MSFKIKNFFKDKYNFIYLMIFINFLYIITNFSNISVFKNIYLILSFNIYSLTNFIPGIYSATILLFFLVLILILLKDNKIQNKFKNITILFFISLILSYLTNLYIISLPYKLIIFFNVLFYITILVVFLYEKNIFEILILLLFFPVITIIYKIWVWTKFFISLITKKAHNLNKLEKKLFIIIRFIFFLWILQFTFFLISKANPIFNELFYNNFYKIISNIVAGLSITFSQVAVLTLLLKLKDLKIFTQKQTNKKSSLIQNIINILFNISFIKILFYAISFTILIYQITNIYSLIGLSLKILTFEMSINRFVLKNIIITTLFTLSLGFLYFNLNNKKMNFINNVIKFLLYINFITTIYLYITLFKQYSFTITRIYSFIMLLTFYFVIFLIIKNKLNNIKELFFITIGLFSIPTILLIVMPWFYILNILWSNIHTIYQDYGYFYSKQLFPETYIYTVNKKEEKPFNSISNLYQELLFCNSNKTYETDYDFSYQRFTNTTEFHNLDNLLTIIKKSAQQYNLMAHTIINYNKKYLNCSKINNTIKKLTLIHLKSNNFKCRFTNICKIKNLSIDSIDFTNHFIYIKFKKLKKSQAYLKNLKVKQYSLPYNQKTAKIIQLKYSNVHKQFYFKYYNNVQNNPQFFNKNIPQPTD